MNGWTVFCVLVLTIASVITSCHLAWTNRRILRLERRVHELEMERDFPGFRRPAPMAPDDQTGGGPPV